MAWSNTTGTTESITSSTMSDVPTNATTAPVSLNPGETADVQVEATFPATPTDNLNWQILSSADGGITWDVQPIAAGMLLNSASPNRITVSVCGYREIKVQAARTGTTDTISVTVRVALDGVSL